MCSPLDPIVLQRHSFAHLLAQSLQRCVDANVQLGTGPWLDNGFYYDVLFSEGVEFGQDKLKDLTKQIRNIAKEHQTFVRYECPLAEGKDVNTLTGQTLKNELLHKFQESGEHTISYYLNVVPINTLEKARNTADGYIEMYQRVSEYFRKKGIIDAEQAVVYIDLCAGPHVENSKEELNPAGMKLHKLSGAYRQADENNVMMTRIYGLCFTDKEALQTYEKMMEEAKKRDHRLIGKQLELFSFDDEVGPGLPLWLPNGAIMIEELETFAKETEARYGYQRVRSPHIAKDKLYLRSGHLPYYEEDMFPAMEMDNEKYYLKAMNCPHHHKIFGATPKSYRDLPARYAEYGHCYRYEDSGSLFGLMRVRSMCMNDAHIYCTPEQFEEEFGKVIEMYLFYFKVFGIKKYEMRLSKHSKAGLGKKYVDNEALRIQTEEQVRNALDNIGVPYVEAEDEAAFYGPKIDVQVWSAIGREFTLSTNQLDFSVPAKFDLKYVDKDGEEKTPICIHRAPLSTHERMMGFLIEEFAGAFPVWLAPTQAIVVPVSNAFDDYAAQVSEHLSSAGLRVKQDQSHDSLNKKIRNAEKLKIPYILVVGEQEETANSVNVREYKTKEQYLMQLEEFKEKLVKEYEERSL